MSALCGDRRGHGIGVTACVRAAAPAVGFVVQRQELTVLQ